MKTDFYSRFSSSAFVFGLCAIAQFGVAHAWGLIESSTYKIPLSSLTSGGGMIQSGTYTMISSAGPPSGQFESENYTMTAGATLTDTDFPVVDSLTPDPLKCDISSTTSQCTLDGIIQEISADAEDPGPFASGVASVTFTLPEGEVEDIPISFGGPGNYSYTDSTPSDGFTAQLLVAGNAEPAEYDLLACATDYVGHEGREGKGECYESTVSIVDEDGPEFHNFEISINGDDFIPASAMPEAVVVYPLDEVYLKVEADDPSGVVQVQFVEGNGRLAPVVLTETDDDDYYIMTEPFVIREDAAYLDDYLFAARAEDGEGLFSETEQIKAIVYDPVEPTVEAEVIPETIYRDPFQAVTASVTGIAEDLGLAPSGVRKILLEVAEPFSFQESGSGVYTPCDAHPCDPNFSATLVVPPEAELGEHRVSVKAYDLDNNEEQVDSRFNVADPYGELDIELDCGGERALIGQPFRVRITATDNIGVDDKNTGLELQEGDPATIIEEVYEDKSGFPQVLIRDYDVTFVGQSGETATLRAYTQDTDVPPNTAEKTCPVSLYGDQPPEITSFKATKEDGSDLPIIKMMDGAQEVDVFAIEPAETGEVVTLEVVFNDPDGSIVDVMIEGERIEAQACTAQDPTSPYKCNLEISGDAALQDNFEIYTVTVTDNDGMAAQEKLYFIVTDLTPPIIVNDSIDFFLEQIPCHRPLYNPGEEIEIGEETETLLGTLDLREDEILEVQLTTRDPGCVSGPGPGESCIGLGALYTAEEIDGVVGSFGDPADVEESRERITLRTNPIAVDGESFIGWIHVEDASVAKNHLDRYFRIYTTSTPKIECE